MTHAHFFPIPAVRRGALLALMAFFCAGAVALGDPRADLESPSQEVRDEAAKTLRETCRPPTSEKWTKLAAELRVGDTVGRVQELLHPLETQGGGIVELDETPYLFQLDEEWGLTCSFQWKGGAVAGITRWGVTRHVKPVRVKPPADFTGLWTSFYANGQPYLTEHFKQGKPVGRGTFYDEDGKARPHS